MEFQSTPKNFKHVALSLFCVFSLPGGTIAFGQDPAPELPESPTPAVAPKPVAPAPAPDEKEATKANILRDAPTMLLEQVEELYRAYGRLGDDATAQKLRAIILERDPGNQSITKEAEIEGAEAGTTTGGQSIERPDPEDAIVANVDQMVKSGRHTEAVRVLQELKQKSYSGRSFPHQQTLAYSLHESGRADDALAAFQSLASDRRQESAARADARKMIMELREKKLVDEGVAAIAAKDGAAALAIANRLQTLNPGAESAVSVRVEALTLLGRHAELLTFLRRVKKGHRSGTFPFQESYAYALYEVEGGDVAEPEFKAILTGSGFTPKQKRSAREQLAYIRRERLIRQAGAKIKEGDGAGALAITTTLMEEIPIADETYQVHAEAQWATGNLSAATATLEKFRSNYTGTGVFPGEADLADYYYEAWNLEEARGSYERLLAAESGVDSKALGDARASLAEIDKILGGGWSYISDWFTEEEGSMWRNEARIKTAWMSGNQFEVRGSHDVIDLAKDRFIKSDGETRSEADLTYRRLVGRQHFASITGGTSNDEALYGFGFGKFDTSAGIWEVRLAGNERATDSLQLEALDGRQDAIHVTVDLPLSNRLNLDVHAFAREVSIPQADLGEGWGFEANLDYQVSPGGIGRTEVTAGYFGEVDVFDANRVDAAAVTQISRLAETGADVAADLIEEKINRHGVQLRLARELTDRLSVSANGGLAYEFEDKEFEWRGGLGAKWQLNPRARIEAVLDYTSSGNAGNSGAGVLFGGIGVHVAF